MNTPNNNIELHSYETFFTSLAWIQNFMGFLKEG